MSRYTHAQRMKLPPFYDYSRARFFARARKDRDDAAFVVLDDVLRGKFLVHSRGISFSAPETLDALVLFFIVGFTRCHEDAQSRLVVYQIKRDDAFFVQ